MRYSAELLLLVSMIFSGALSAAIIGAESRIRVTLEIVGFMLVGITVRVAGGIMLGASALAGVSPAAFALIAGIAASLARIRVNQQLRLKETVPD